MIDVDVLVIGAGAAGLMCAITAGQRGRKVLVVDHANKMGKKILMSGGGRCNFTNMFTEPANYLSENEHFVKSALSRYTQWDFIALVEKHGIPYHEKKLGQLFCDNKAKDIVDMLQSEADEAGVDIQLRCQVHSVVHKHQFRVETSLGVIRASSVVIATGGLSIPTMGATGFGYDIARQYGLHVTDHDAALVPFVLSARERKQFVELSGSSVDVVVECGGQSFRESMLFTHKGLSGPAMLQISSYWRKGETLKINLLPELDLYDYLTDLQKNRPKAELKTVMGELLTRKMAGILCDLWIMSKPLNQYSSRDLMVIASHFHSWQVKPIDTEGYRTAEVTRGGVNTNELSSKTMEANKQPGLYFIGEVADVTGHLGGFNFQWAWASGYAAGEYV